MWFRCSPGFLIIALACTDPQEPPPPIEPPSYNLTVSADSLEAVGTCESPISIDQSIGGPIDGDFGYSFKVSWPDGSVATIAATTGYPSPGALWQAVKGQKHNWNSQIVHIRKVTGSNLPPTSLTFEATEFDWDVLAQRWTPDPDLSGVQQSRSHGYNERLRSSLIAQGTTTLPETTLAEGCALRVHYTFSSVAL